MSRTTRLLAAAACLLLAPAPATAQARPAAGDAGPGDLVVRPDWLRAHLADPGLVVLAVDMPPGGGGNRPPGYAAGHVPGARRLDPRTLATGDGDGGTLTMEMVAPDSVRRVLAGLGVSDRSRVVLYGPKAWTTLVARAFVALDHAGLGDRTHVLDGGYEAWTAAGGAADTVVPRVTPGRLAAARPSSVVVDGAWLRARLDDPSLTLLDARDRPFYAGAELGHQAARTGHIPGARNLFYRALLDTARNAFLPADSARALFAAAGAPLDRVAPAAGRTLVVYCHIGQTASVAYLQARRAGARVRLYDGSFQDWSRRGDFPVAAGAGGAGGAR